MYLLELLSSAALLHEIWKAALLFSACWFSICYTHYLHDLQTQTETSSFFAITTTPVCSLGDRAPFTLSAFASQHGFMFSEGEGHRKGITLSLDV